MNKWNIVYSEQAAQDLRDIYEYIAYNLLEPGPCKAILDNIVFLGLPQSIALAGQKRTQPRHGA